MQDQQASRYDVRLATDASDLARVQAFRGRFFGSGGVDADSYDPLCAHLMIEGQGGLAGCLRLLPMACGAEWQRSYSAQFYDLSCLSARPDPMIEVGRFCTDPGLRDADVLRAALGGIAGYVDRMRAGLLFGCSSFPGTDPQPLYGAFAWLRAHLAPFTRQAVRRAANIYDFAVDPAVIATRADPARLPPLLRGYLGLGGQVSDHAVIDGDLQTLHVFTAVEIAAIPEPRKRALRLLAATLQDLRGMTPIASRAASSAVAGSLRTDALSLSKTLRKAAFSAP